MRQLTFPIIFITLFAVAIGGLLMWPSNFKSEPFELKRSNALYNFYQGSPNRKLNRSKAIIINDVRVLKRRCDRCDP